MYTGEERSYLLSCPGLKLTVSFHQVIWYLDSCWSPVLWSVFTRNTSDILAANTLTARHLGFLYATSETFHGYLAILSAPKGTSKPKTKQNKQTKNCFDIIFIWNGFLMTVHPLLHSESMTLIISTKQSLLCAPEGQLLLSACWIHHVQKPDGVSWFGSVLTVAHRPAADLQPPLHQCGSSQGGSSLPERSPVPVSCNF